MGEDALASLRVHVDEDVVGEEGETLEDGLLLVGGDLRVAGRVEGSVVLVGGALTLAEGGRIDGDVHLADDARLYRDGGTVDGRVATVRAAEPADRGEVERDLRDRLRDEIRRELRTEIREDIRDATRGIGGGWNPLRSIGRGLGGLLENLVSVLVLGVLIGGLMVHFAPHNLDVVTRTVRDAPLRAAMVGVAGAFVALPAWVLGFVALAISIVGILAIPFWAVLFPLAVALAIALGYVAVAQILGEWVAQQRYQRLDWVRAGNPYSTVVAGVGAIMVAFMLSNVLEMAGPWTGVFQGILVFLGVLATLAAAITGFGAVLLTRGGRRAEYGGFGDWDLDLKSAAPPPPASDGFGTGGSRSGPSSGAREAGAAEGPRPGRVPESGDAGEPRPERPAGSGDADDDGHGGGPA
ncbi:MAG: polymer-forming cytoskeletal protein [Gemmatimonadetes bacterium]|nr:polymer-forming cytoskeletal protein [Gemmatimonadota bacterium]